MPEINGLCVLRNFFKVLELTKHIERYEKKNSRPEN